MPQARPTILVVDSDGLHRESVRHVLRASGYRVLEAADYRGALNAHQQHRGQINLLLTAIALAGGNGHELANALVQDEPFIKVLFVTGETGAKVSEFYDSDYAASRTLRRPFEPAVLVQRVKDTLKPPCSTALA